MLLKMTEMTESGGLRPTYVRYTIILLSLYVVSSESVISVIYLYYQHVTPLLPRHFFVPNDVFTSIVWDNSPSSL